MKTPDAAIRAAQAEGRLGEVVCRPVRELREQTEML